MKTRYLGFLAGMAMMAVMPSVVMAQHAVPPGVMDSRKAGDAVEEPVEMTVADSKALAADSIPADIDPMSGRREVEEQEVAEQQAGQQEDGINYIYLVLGAFSLIFFALSILLFMQVNSHKKRESRQLDRIRELDETIGKLQSQVNDYREKNDKQVEQINSLSKKIEKSKQKETPKEIKPEADSNIYSIDDFPEHLYVGVPSGGVFGEGNRKDRPGKTLYRIDLDSADTGRFCFIESEMNFRLAKTNITQFVESACEILNADDVVNPRQIVTENPGSVVKTEDGWKIISKANVRFV